MEPMKEIILIKIRSDRNEPQKEVVIKPNQDLSEIKNLLLKAYNNIR
jgi:hypothetical protein